MGLRPRRRCAAGRWVGFCDAGFVNSGVTDPDAEPAGTDAPVGPGPQASMEVNDLRLNWDYDLYGRMFTVRPRSTSQTGFRPR